MSVQSPDGDVEALRRAIQLEYADVADHLEFGFHFLFGRPLAKVLGYDPTCWKASRRPRSNRSLEPVIRSA